MSAGSGGCGQRRGWGVRLAQVLRAVAASAAGPGAVSASVPGQWCDTDGFGRGVFRSPTGSGMDGSGVAGEMVGF